MKGNNCGWRFWVVLLLLLASFESRGQFWDSGSGLLQMPSGDMPQSGTVMISSLFLNKQSTDPVWDYNTFGYGIGIVFLHRIEIGYAMTLFNEKWKGSPNPIVFNQDRHFYGKIQLLKEGEFGKRWIPAISVGLSDPTTGETRKGDIDYTDFDVSEGNGYFNRYYVVATKHFSTSVGVIGAHLGYQYSQRTENPFKGPCIAVDWVPIWLDTSPVSIKAIAEYDSRTFNVGFIASIWEDRFELMFDLMALQWVSFGVRFNFVLKN